MSEDDTGDRASVILSQTAPLPGVAIVEEAPLTDPPPRELIRAALALALVALLFAEIGAGVYAMLFQTHDQQSIEAVKDLLTIVLGPTVALVGAATGFYYGEKNRR